MVVLKTIFALAIETDTNKQETAPKTAATTTTAPVAQIQQHHIHKKRTNTIIVGKFHTTSNNEKLTRQFVIICTHVNNDNTHYPPSIST